MGYVLRQWWWWLMLLLLPLLPRQLPFSHLHGLNVEVQESAWVWGDACEDWPFHAHSTWTAAKRQPACWDRLCLCLTGELVGALAQHGSFATGASGPATTGTLSPVQKWKMLVSNLSMAHCLWPTPMALPGTQSNWWQLYRQRRKRRGSSSGRQSMDVQGNAKSVDIFHGSVQHCTSCKWQLQTKSFKD